VSLAPHPRFAKLPKAFLKAFGTKNVPFTLKPGTPEEVSVTFDAIIREEADAMNEAVGGSGIEGEYAYLRLLFANGDLLSEGDSLVYFGVTFKITSVGSVDGRGMMGFDLARVNNA